jgi:hypothetical protein
MSVVSAGRAILRRWARRRPDRLDLDPKEAPVFWGRIGAYDAVSRSGMLFLLAPEPSHPALRVKSGA